MQVTPRFVHDCVTGCCTFVGRTMRYDVYTTRSGGLIMRDGDDGPNYRCYPTMVIARMVAKKDAEALRPTAESQAPLGPGWIAAV